MKLPQRLLQVGTLALFSSMVGSLVLYRSGFFEPAPSEQISLLNEKTDSLPQPWFDSVQFRQVIQQVTQTRKGFEPVIYSSKSAPPFPMPPPKTMDKSKSAETSARTREEIALSFDTLVALSILRTRYEVAHLSAQDAQAFQRIYADREKTTRSEVYYYKYWGDPVFLSGDSSIALVRLKYGPQHLPLLSSEEQARFQFVLDSLTRPRMMSTKSGIIFLSAVDTMQAIKLVKSEKRH